MLNCRGFLLLGCEKLKNLFKYISYFFLGLTIILVTLPFLYVIKNGLGFIFTFPYPEEITYAFKISIKTALISSVFCMIFTLMVCYAMDNSSEKFKNFSNYIFSIPLGIPHIVSGIALISFFGQKGIGKFLLDNFSIDFVYTVSGIILAQFFVNLPYSIKTFNQTYEMVDKKLLFSARSLGLNEVQVFFYVIVPMLKKQIFSMWMINISRALGEFGAVMMLVGVTRMKTETLATSIFLNMSTGDFDVACGVSIILILVSMVTTFIFQRLMKKENIKC